MFDAGFRHMTIKDRIETFQSIVTIIAILGGSLWSYALFVVKEGGYYPSENIVVNIEHALSHIALSKDINLLRVSMTVKNTGTSLLEIKKMFTRVQQILPVAPCADIQPCAVDQVNKALRRVETEEERFSWPLISERTKNLNAPVEIGPSEQEQMDFEFAVPSNVTDVRIYSYIRNEKKKEVGWSLSSYYKLDTKKRK